MTLTPLEALTQQAQARPKSAAFIFHDEAWTYERILHAAEAVARGMASRGVRRGDRVALHMMNRPEFIIAYYACFRLGATAAPLRTAFKLAELAPLLQRLEPALYIGERDLYPNVAAVDGAILPRDKRVIVGATTPGHDGLPWEKLLEAAGSEPASAGRAADEAAVLITTSGTTGEPKFVVHTPKTLGESVALLIRNWGFCEEDVIAMPLPLAHMSGLMSMVCCMQLGSLFVLQESFEPNQVLDAIERHRCTLQLGFPTQYAALLDRQHERPRNLQSLRYCLTGADACPLDLQQQVSSAFGAPLYNVWAASEAAGNLSFSLRAGPVTRIAKGTQLRLVDETGDDVANGEIGELLLRGPNLFAGYWNDPQATADSMEGGWYHTGDLMQRGEDEELIFVARKKDIIVRGGTNISPIEVEQALVACHPAVEEAAVVGIPDRILGQRVVGFVKLVNGAGEVVTSDILRQLTTALATYKVPERLVALDRLPRNALGKVDRKMLQAHAMTLSAEDNQPRSATTSLPIGRFNQRPSRRAVPIR